ncbi:hypothetical protein [Sulfolobus ellipsoid virus 1]|uniref:Uncharacterized protein n=1 Tax=Sulfolobus ellipsoid virus 1 TaxID=2056194 RepID=A0A2H4RBN5_9VIRU|nr:hypothetical protein FGG62_gp08 [Sulfolobus ellipsoid virus 1]ATY46486.1 hypothetical protein [Sulfolobus ellipsoid virus 1]
MSNLSKGLKFKEKQASFLYDLILREIKTEDKLASSITNLVVNSGSFKIDIEIGEFKVNEKAIEELDNALLDLEPEHTNYDETVDKIMTYDFLMDEVVVRGYKIRQILSVKLNYTRSTVYLTTTLVGVKNYD